MMSLIITIVIFLLLILVVVWVPFLRQENVQGVGKENNVRDETNVELYHEHKAEIERDYQQGRIDDESYEYLIAELEKSLVRDIADNKNAAAEFDERQKRFSVAWPVVISLFVLVFSFALYNKTGSFAKLTEHPQATTAKGGHEQLDESQQMIVRVQKLQQQTQAQPENSEAWYSLGMGLVGVGDFDGAIDAFNQVLRIEGEVADVYGAIAQAEYYKHEQNLTPHVQSYIDKALAIDPQDPSTNILLGMHNFVSQNYQSAIDYWQKVVDSGRETVNVAALKEAIQEANNRLSMTGPMQGSQQGVEAEASGPQIQVAVSLSDDVYAQLSEGEDKTVFIYATPVDGSRMPVAAVKMQASDLPVKVILNDARAMTPQAKLSDIELTHIYAIVSKEGGAGIKPGDFKAESLGVNVMTKDVVELVVDSIVE